MNKLIAFTGLATCGKTTAADYLVKGHGYVRMSFAQPIRQMLSAIGVTPQEMSEGKNVPCEKLCGKTPRFAMQTLGTEWARRHIGDDLWVRALCAHIRTARDYGLRHVIDDCRFDNEAAAVKEMGGVVIRIERPGLVAMAHASERGISPELVDAVIFNALDMNTLFEQVEAVCQ